MGEFQGRRILYTGAAGGLGLPASLALMQAGAEVIVLDNDPAKIAALKAAAAARDLSERLTVSKVDLTDKTALEETLSGLLARGPVDTAINNAAIYPSKPFEDFTMDEHAKIHAVNVEAALMIVKALLPGMREAGFGRIINISSITVSGGWENLTPYIQSKGALIMLARGWAREFGKWGITVNTLSPGAFPTDAEKIHPDQEAYQRRIIDSQAIKRRGAPEDLAEALMFLISTRAGFITGQNLNVDGGWVMH
ncbi:SDR family NAD(P)-dependent oxidoreductase [Martelella radicis]|uniref:NAD(P)-dependent dehydrogenase (Short-subunit alcohol dehydrogenase family) n=1 Tax=Martelella radicis TaxID=1397476 RepID=A0A7W6KH25_9HYPH|nr:SDR family oxidoreductase [Martelella radicis]MBB4120947.1 NAD(P)-dependent dehydrogenase (short-subunit alcohol dehydrogenase family) [Martelella radicis]